MGKPFFMGYVGMYGPKKGGVQVLNTASISAINMVRF